MKKEEVYTTTYSDFEEAKRALFSYISSIGYLLHRSLKTCQEKK
ncbi:hypothetical protein CU012_2700 [Enterococcus faecium]|nr:hypothetical protein [Enterococcus faecium]